MKRIIKIHNENVSNHLVVDWKLHNVCNYDCSFCNSSSKSGSERFLESLVYFDTANKLMDIGDKENKTIRFFITGGEPTLLPVLPELIALIKHRGHYVRMNTNGSRTLRWWQDFIEKCGEHSIDYIVLSAHIEQNCDLSHLIKVTELYKSHKTIMLCSVTAPPENWAASIAAQQQLIEHSMAFIHLRGIFKINNKLAEYNPEQLHKLKTDFILPSKRLIEKDISDISNWEIVTAIFDDHTEETSNGQYFVNANLTNFFGFKCSIGQYRLLIDYNTVYKGVCRQDGAIGTIYNFNFATAPTLCTRKACMCGADVLQPKWK